MKDNNLFNEDFSLKYNKIANTIKSCKTDEHTEAAYKMINNFTKLFFHSRSYTKLGFGEAFCTHIEFDKRINELDRLLKQKCAELHGANNTIGEEFRSRLEPLFTILLLWKTLNRSENKSMPNINKIKIKEDFNLAVSNLDSALDDLMKFSIYLDNYIFDPIKYENSRK